MFNINKCFQKVHISFLYFYNSSCSSSSFVVVDFFKNLLWLPAFALFTMFINDIHILSFFLQQWTFLSFKDISLHYWKLAKVCHGNVDFVCQSKKIKGHFIFVQLWVLSKQENFSVVIDFFLNTVFFIILGKFYLKI